MLRTKIRTTLRTICYFFILFITARPPTTFAFRRFGTLFVYLFEIRSIFTSWIGFVRSILTRGCMTLMVSIGKCFFFGVKTSRNLHQLILIRTIIYVIFKDVKICFVFVFTTLIHFFDNITRVVIWKLLPDGIKNHIIWVKTTRRTS